MSMKTSNRLLIILFLFILLIATLAIVFIFNLHKITSSTIVGNGIQKGETRNISAYNEIDIAGPFNVRIKCGDKNMLRVQGDSNILSCIQTEVESDTLYIFSDNTVKPKLPIEIEIHVSDIKKMFVWSSRLVSLSNINNSSLVVSSSGKGFITVSGKTKDLVLDCNGSGNINTSRLLADNVEIALFGEGNVETLAMVELKVKIFGAGSLTACGKTKNLSVTCSGAGSINTQNLSAENAEISLNGAATADISVVKKLNVKISGLGRVTYYGQPKEIEQKITGLGKIVDGEKYLLK